MKAIATVPLLALAVALSGCSVYDELVRHEKEHHFDAYADAPTSGDLAFALPEWVPTDATDIDLRVITDGPGAIIRLSSATAPAGCVDGELGDVSLLDSSWWPYPTPTEGSVCGTWRVFVEDGVTYGWTRE